MAEQYARQAEQHLAQLPANQRAQVTQNEDTLAKWITDTVIAGLAWDTAKKSSTPNPI
jgi:hypothetical protein